MMPSRKLIPLALLLLLDTSRMPGKDAIFPQLDVEGVSR
jgi:hypothetical protein